MKFLQASYISLKVFNREYLQSLYFPVIIIIVTLAAIAKEAEIYRQLPEASDLRNENIYNPRANGAKRRSGRKPGARVTNSAIRRVQSGRWG